MPERNALVKAMKDKPVKFLAIAANVTPLEANGYVQQTQLAMPVYADSLGLMQKRYGQQISLKNIWQYRVIGPDGKVVGYDMKKPALEKILENVKPEWKFKGEEYDPKLGPAVDAFEWGQYPQGIKLLTSLRRNPNKEIAASAAKLYEAVKKEGEAWKEEAEPLVETEPVRAYDLYSRVATVFAGDPLGKSVAGPLKKLRSSKEVVAELAARKAFAQTKATMGRLTPMQKAAAAKLCRDIAKRYQATPTGEQADSLAKELGN